jgi:hypothetical protein
MKRREFFQKAGIASAAMASIPAIGGAAPPRAVSNGTAAAKDDQDEHGRHGGRDEIRGALASATVSFGQWDPATGAAPALTAPVDRFPNLSPRARNNHSLIPSEVTIKAGGAVNFVISGLHQVLVYGPGVEPSDIDRTLLIPATVPPAPPAPPPMLINDPKKRVYRGIDPTVMPMLAGGALAPTILQDRLEVVRFPSPGRYLVICGLLVHFFDAATSQFVMFGYVKVLPSD